jgi:hypothetical protein
VNINLDNHDSPRFLLNYDFTSRSLDVLESNVYPSPLQSKRDEYTVFVIGSPILNNKVNKNKILLDLLEAKHIESNYIKSLDGEFLLILVNHKNNTLEVANDRFTSFPIYYHHDDSSVTISYSYLDIAKVVSQKKDFKIRNEILFEFLWFRRVFNESTYDTKTLFLKPARIIKLSTHGKDEYVYWKPNFIKNSNSLSENSAILSDLISSSLEKKNSDLIGNRTGLFLSGGMDTRTVLAAFCKSNNLPECLTVGYSQYGEYEVAKLLTNKLDTKHHFIHIPENYNDTNWSEKLHLTGGMYNQFSPIFSGNRDKISPIADVFFHGHGLDYMFQGMYLPSRPIRLFGKNTYYKKIIDINKIDNFSEYFARNIAFRTWKVDLEDYLLPEYKEEMFGGLVSRLDKILDEGSNICNDNFDMWEYFMTHTPSRHYSQPDVISMSTNGEQRKVANDNDLFNFYFSLPLQHRLYARVMRGALRNLSPSFANIISANTRYKIDATPTQLTTHFAIYKAMRGITNNKRYSHPSAEDRTWADDDIEVRIRPRLNKHVANLSNSEYLHEYMPFFDFDLLKRKTKYWVEGNNPGGGLFLTSLLTIENLLKEIYD